MMRFKIDENLPVDVALRLRTAGHDATTVTEQDMVGDPDTTLSETCRREHMALVSLDLDSADIRSYPPEEHPGLIVLRVSGRGKRHIMEVFERFLNRYLARSSQNRAGRLRPVAESLDRAEMKRSHEGRGR